MIGKKNIVPCFILGLFFIGLLLPGCGGAESLSGTYLAEKHYTDSLAGSAGFEFHGDGTFTLLPLGAEGNYEVEGNTVTLKNQFLGDGLELSIEGGKLVAPGGQVVYGKQ